MSFVCYLLNILIYLLDTHVIWGVNLGSNNVTAAYLEAKSILKAFSSPDIVKAGIHLDALEIGNEADLYKNNGLRATTYNISQYVKEWVPFILHSTLKSFMFAFRWVTFATNLSTSLELSPGTAPSFWGAGFAGSSHSTSGFSPQSFFNQGILNTSVGPLIST